MFQGCNGRVCDTRSLLSRDSLLSGFVCRLGCLLNIQPCRCLLVVVEKGGGGGLDDLRETRLQDLLRENARPDCASDHTLDARFGCDESSQVCRSSDVSRSLEPNSGLACIEGCLCRAVRRETREEPFERPLPDLVVDRCDVVGMADAQTFSKEGELCLRILAKLDALVHCAP